MKIKVSNNYPPNIEAIRQTFGAAAIRQAIFTYGTTVYIPTRVPMAAHLVAHEETHVLQQGNDPAAWWDRYLVDPEFRLQQELEAYRNQYEFIVQHHDRKFRRAALQKIAKDLASAMYGHLLTPDEARAAVAQKD